MKFCLHHSSGLDDVDKVQLTLWLEYGAELGGAEDGQRGRNWEVRIVEAQKMLSRREGIFALGAFRRLPVTCGLHCTLVQSTSKSGGLNPPL